MPIQYEVYVSIERSIELRQYDQCNHDLNKIIHNLHKLFIYKFILIDSVKHKSRFYEATYVSNNTDRDDIGFVMPEYQKYLF